MFSKGFGGDAGGSGYSQLKSDTGMSFCWALFIYGAKSVILQGRRCPSGDFGAQKGLFYGKGD